MQNARKGDRYNQASVTKRSPAHPVSSGSAPASSAHATGDRGAVDYPALVRAAAAGRRDALEQLLMRSQEVAYRFGLTVCGHTEDAEDVMQEALLKTYQQVARIRDPEAFRAWLYRTVKNACLMRRRRRIDEPRQMLSLDELLPSPGAERGIPVPDPARGPEEAISDARVRRRLQEAFRQLPGRFRVVVFLREMEGLSTREAAHVLGISEANVKTRLHRAHLFLRKALQ
jgi:RNA polymerase sigma-70 factor, ECF subfamily